MLQLNLRLLSEEEIVKQLSEIFKEEKISFDDESLKIISKSASGSMRDALTISEKVISYCNGKLKKEDVQALLGIPSEEKVFALLGILKDRDSKGLYEFFENFDEKNDSCQNLLESLMKSIQEISLMQFSSDKESNLSKFAEMSPEYLQLIYQIGLSNKIYFETSSDPKRLLSMTLIKMIAFCPEEKNFKLANLNSTKDEGLFNWDEVLKIDLSALLNRLCLFRQQKKIKKL